MWPGLVGKGSESEPRHRSRHHDRPDRQGRGEWYRSSTAIDIFHVAPHTNIDFTDDEVKRLAEKVPEAQPDIGSIVAPVWPPVGGGSAMGSAADRKKFVANVEKSCNLGTATARPGRAAATASIRIDSAASPGEWAKDPAGNTKKIAKTFREACSVAADYGERLACRRRNLLGRHAFLEGHDRHARRD